MKSILFILFLFPAIFFSQTETHHWQVISNKYELNSKTKTVAKQTTGFVSFLRNSYQFLISDYDGNNCPFYPSCSKFFVEAVQKTNLFEGFLMFADRFTRDLNYFNRGNYEVKKFGKLYDPPDKYILW